MLYRSLTMPPKRIPKDVKIWNEDLTRAAEYRYSKAGESFPSISALFLCFSSHYAHYGPVLRVQQESINEMKTAGEKPKIYLQHRQVQHVHSHLNQQNNQAHVSPFF